MVRSTSHVTTCWNDDVVREVLAFWFVAVGPDRWFNGGPKLDRDIFMRFLALHRHISGMNKSDLMETAEHALAAIVVLDQFSRQMFRGTARAFESDPAAVDLATASVALGYDRAVGAERRVFFYLPFEHAENIAAQERSVKLISELGDADYTRYAIAHRDVIAQFGRFPHRNTALRRLSTDAERAYLAKPGSGF